MKKLFAICFLALVLGQVSGQTTIDIQNMSDTPRGITLGGSIWTSSSITLPAGCQIPVAEGIKELVSLGDGRNVALTPNNEVLWYQGTTRLGPPKQLSVGTWHISAQDNTLIVWSREGDVSFFQDTTITTSFTVSGDVLAVMPNGSMNATSGGDSFLVVREMSRIAELLTEFSQATVVIDYNVEPYAVRQRNGTLMGFYIDSIGESGYGGFTARDGNLVLEQRLTEPTLYTPSSTGSLIAYMATFPEPKVVCDSLNHTTVYLNDYNCNVTPIISHFGPNTGTFIQMRDQNTIVFGSDGVGYWKFPGQPQTYTFTGVATVYLNGTTAVDLPEQATQLAYPNPFTDHIVVAGGVKIFDIAGRLVYQDDNDPITETSISTSLWASGMYTIVGPQGSQKILKQ